MTRLLTQAFAAAAALSDEQQDELARVVLGLAGVAQAPYVLTPEEQADLDEAELEIARGEVLTLDEASAMWAKHDL